MDDDPGAPTPFDPEAFDALRAGDWRPPSTLTALLPGWAPAPTAEDVLDRPLPPGFEDLGLIEVPLGEGDPDGALFALEGEDVRVVGHEIDVVVHGSDRGTGFTDADAEAAEGAHHAITLRTVLGEPVLDELHRAVRLIAALAPHATCLRDVECLAWRPASWIQGVAASQAPPSPLHLFSVHMVHHEGRAWLHTHGLVRCGAVELEVVDVDAESSRSLVHVLNTAAVMCIERGTPDPGAPFTVGRGMTLAWRPWNDHLRDGPDLVVGGLDDREDHDFLSGCLLLHTGRTRGLLRKRPVWGSVEELVPLVEDEPLFYRSTMETRRAAMLASEHFPTFRRLVQRHMGEPGWSFLVKLGYQVDPAEGDDEPYDENEHMWFDVHGVDGARIDGTLLNQPYRIARMSPGDRDWHAADQLSDWSIEAHGHTYGPDRIAQLLERLEADG